MGDWFSLGVAVFLVVMVRLRPGGRSWNRGQLAFAGALALLALTRLLGVEDGLELALHLAAALLAAAAVVLPLFAFREFAAGSARPKP